ncbi:hypothetical protein RJ640_014381 [Escallonia rubra]|uniref:Uncharacterized protein n=1 Tax=Escallonia rubra TaxID=112253 RepID=A0AA88QSJ7_9ASTE|nr:hypothetical protein RJ640_014381 [Escallonia rubra]
MAEEKNQFTKLPEQQPLPRPYRNLSRPNRDLNTIWPELVGLTSEAAEEIIKQDMPSAVVRVIPQDCDVTADYRTNRVRIFIDSAGKVFMSVPIGFVLQPKSRHPNSLLPWATSFLSTTFESSIEGEAITIRLSRFNNEEE